MKLFALCALALSLLADNAEVSLTIDGQPVTLRYYSVFVGSAPVSNTEDRTASWHFNARVIDSNGAYLGWPVLRSYPREDCVPTDPEKIARMVIGNTVQGMYGYVRGYCPAKK